MDEKTGPVTKPRRLNLLPPNPEASQDMEAAVGPGRFPSWLHRPLPKGNTLVATSRVVKGQRLHTVCEEAKCPNLLECWSHKTATFLAMGKECSRACGFCDIDFSKAPKGLDPEEPSRIAESVKQLGLRHVVITMVARDDLEDGGADHLVKIVETLRQEVQETTIELLTSDFNGNEHSLEKMVAAKPEIFNHNIETVRALTPHVRHKATYDRTLYVLNFVKQRSHTILIKSGIMVGLGESESEVFQTLQDLKKSGVDIVTIGQYLQPSRHKLLVKSFVTPEQFKKYEEYGYSIGLSYVYSGPFVRSSYNANVVIKNAQNKILNINSD